jgi:hypothetical protein
MTLNMKRFRINAFNLGLENDEEGSDDSDVEGESPAAIKKRHRREIERSERENRENTSALLELRDLEDELKTLQKLFDTQESTIRQMRDIYTSKDLNDLTKNGQEYLNDALEYLDDYKQQTSEMIKRVDTTRKDVCLVPTNQRKPNELTMSCSTRKCSRWRNGRRKLTRSAGHACKQSWRRAKTSRS